MNKSIINATILLLIAGIFFVTNDAIINFLSQTGNINFGSQVGESFIKFEDYF